MNRIIHLDLPKEWDKAEIYALSDLHRGDAFMDLPLFYRFRDHILAEPYRYVLCIGDLANNATKNSVSNVYNEQISPSQQRKWLKKELYPLRERIKIIIPGNHEYRTIKESDVDITEDLADVLGISEYFRPEEAVLKVTLGRGKNGKKVCYTIYCVHGAGGGGTAGGALNRVVSLSNSIDCDIYIMGHVHRKIAHKDVFRRVDLRNNIVTDDNERLYVTSSSYTSFGGYAARGMFRPSAKGSVPISLSGIEKNFTAKV